MDCFCGQNVNPGNEIIFPQFIFSCPCGKEIHVFCLGTWRRVGQGRRYNCPLCDTPIALLVWNDKLNEIACHIASRIIELDLMGIQLTPAQTTRINDFWRAVG